MTRPANDNFLHADVANVLADIDALLAAYPELAEDDQLKADMLEGSTAAYDVLTRLVNIERDADSMGKAVAARVSDLQARKARADKRKEMARTLMLKVMSAANIKKASLVEATLSISRGRDSVEVTDIDALADEYIRIERIPDKKALLDILRSDGEIPGARLKMGGDTMTVRVA